MSATTTELGIGVSLRGREPRREVLVIDDHAWLADVCASVVRNFGSVSCSVVSVTADDALIHAGRDWCRVFVHLAAPCSGGLLLLRALARYELADRVCVVTATECDDTLSEVQELGVLSFLPTSMSVRDFLAALRRVMEGTSVLPHLARNEPVPRLSERQLAVLRLLQAGMSSKQIARNLYIAEGTAKNHTQALLRMLDATNRAHAVARAIELGLLSARKKG